MFIRFERPFAKKIIQLGLKGNIVLDNDGPMTVTSESGILTQKVNLVFLIGNLACCNKHSKEQIIGIQCKLKEILSLITMDQCVR